MNNYETVINILDKLFKCDYQFAMATTENDIPSVRFVDTYFDSGTFYVVTYAKTNKVKEITENPNVALCGRKGYSFSGKAYNIGHPLSPENKEIRDKLINAFEPWYFKHNDEKDDICILKIVPKSGFVHKDGTGYKIDFINKTAEIFPYVFNTILTEE